jgi:YD repeat-containing protein
LFHKVQFDPLNRLTSMVDSVGTTKYTYTAAGQLFTEDGPFASDTVTNTYVNRLRTALGLQRPSGKWTNGFAYDLARRLTNVVSPAGSFTNLFSAGSTTRLLAVTLAQQTFEAARFSAR